ncbi:MAG: hypothetical protein ACFCUU_12720 [Cyclobacteriaceae bacterium]
MAQENQRINNLRHQSLRNFTGSLEKVKVVNPENNRSDSVAINEIMIPENSSRIFSYDKRVQMANRETQQSLKTIAAVNSIDLSELRILPELYLARGRNTNSENVYQIIFTSILPFRYQFDDKEFKSKIGFSLIKQPPDGNQNYQLNQPVSLEIASNIIQNIQPKHLEINRLYFPSYDVELADRNVRDSAMIRIITKSNTTGYETYIKVEPALELSSNRITLQGFGVQETPVSVRFIGSSSTDSVRVELNAEKGNIEPRSIYLKYNEPKSVMLRSEGMGETKISATASNTTSNSLQLEYIFPWLFIVFSIAGGIFGSIAKFYTRKNHPKLNFKPILGGALIGVIGAIAYYVLGLNLLQLQVSATFNEFAVFGFSTLCAFVGLKPQNK